MQKCINKTNRQHKKKNSKYCEYEYSNIDQNKLGKKDNDKSTFRTDISGFIASACREAKCICKFQNISIT